MKIAVEGCAHGELEKIYQTLKDIEERDSIKIDLLLCCGDFQSTRNQGDLLTMAVPRKYMNMSSFYKYYNGECIAPILTIFIGGNHEASNYLQELPYGGWVAPNIYYLGYSGVVRVNGIRIGGISGIFKKHDFSQGRYEFSPYSEKTRRSVYHIRNLDVFRLEQLSGKLDIFLSHDWPKGIYNFGNKEQLLRFKPHFEIDIENNELGNEPCEKLLKVLKPAFWFAAHLHCKFSAIVPHGNVVDVKLHKDTPGVKYTKFLALDKCLPKRRYLQILEIPTEYTSDTITFEYDLEWLAILNLTNHLINVKETKLHLPSQINDGRYNFTPTPKELEIVKKKIDNLQIPQNFCRTADGYNVLDSVLIHDINQPECRMNPQTQLFCDILEIDDPLNLLMLIIGNKCPEYIKKSTNKINLIMDPLQTVSTENISESTEGQQPYSDSSESISTLQKDLLESKNSYKSVSTDATRSNSASVCLNSSNLDSAQLKNSLTGTSFKRRNQDIYAENNG